MNDRIDTSHLNSIALADACARHTKAVTRNIMASHEQTLSLMAEELAHKLSQPGATERLIRLAIAMGAPSAGQALVDLVKSCIGDEALTQAKKEIEHEQRSIGGTQRKHFQLMQARREISAAYYGYSLSL